MQIDINCDMGESTTDRIIGDDAAIMPFISSANIACGFHGGSPSVMRDTILLAQQNGVAVGAHPSFPDLEGFGRREMDLPPRDVHAMVVYQVGAMKAMAGALGVRLHHVKPHGALYNMAARSQQLSEAIVQAVLDVDPSLVFYALSGSVTVSVARTRGLNCAEEVFADRGYEADGSLTPRSRAGALLPGADAALRQVLGMVRDGVVTSTDNRKVNLMADTVCIHGDGDHALDIARTLQVGLRSAGITITPYTIPV
jgi:UPF0271 protein